MPKNRSTRRRKLPGPPFKGETQANNNAWLTKFKGDSLGKQITVSEGNHWPPPKEDGIVDEGSDFYTTKSRMEGNFSYVQLTSSPVAGNIFRFRGNLFALPTDMVDIVSSTGFNTYLVKAAPTSELTTQQLDQLGATAIARCKPGEPVADLATFLGELLKDGLPTVLGLSLLKGRSHRKPKQLADEYLNYQFGYRPLVNDGMKFVHAVTHADEVLRQYERDSGKVVRRHYSFPSTNETTTTELSPNAAPFAASTIWADIRQQFALEGAKLYRDRNISREVWFSGSFTYYLPADYESSQAVKRYAARVNALLGTDLTIETLWNIGPWSWAVDWFSNVGDVLSNVQDFKANGLVMHYGYLMAKTITKDTYYLVYPSYHSRRPQISNVVLVTETKQRRKANPFGFGVSWDGLTPTQASIAAALGLSRSR